MVPLRDTNHREGIFRAGERVSFTTYI